MPNYGNYYFIKNLVGLDYPREVNYGRQGSSSASTIIYMLSTVVCSIDINSIVYIIIKISFMYVSCMYWNQL